MLLKFINAIWVAPLPIKVLLIVLYLSFTAFRIWGLHDDRLAKIMLSWQGPQPIANEPHWHHYWRWSKFSWKCFVGLFLVTFVVSWIAVSPGMPGILLGVMFIPTILMFMAFGAGLGAVIQTIGLRLIRDRKVYDPKTKTFLEPQR
jgi:hypothetical protein